MPRVQDPVFSRKLGAAIFARRAWLGLSGRELGERIGISAAQVAKHETGFNSPSAILLSRIATALGTTPNDLMGIGDPPEDSRAHIEDLSALLTDRYICSVVTDMRAMNEDDRMRAQNLVASLFDSAKGLNP